MPSWQQVKDTVRRFGLAALALVSFAAPFAVSLAANVTAGLHSGSQVLLVAGVAIPILLMLAIELWRRLPPAEGVARFARGVAMAAPVAVAAGWSWLDTTSLLLAQFPGPDGPWWVQRVLCVAAPLAVDGLAVLSVLSLHAGNRQESAEGSASAQVTTSQPSPDQPGISRAPWGGPDTVTAPGGASTAERTTPTGSRACPSTARSVTSTVLGSQEQDTPAPLRAVSPTRRSPGVAAVPGWTRESARARCAELGVPQRGTVAELVDRITAAERERAGSEGATAAEATA